VYSAIYQFPLPFIPSRQGRGRVFLDGNYFVLPVVTPHDEYLPPLPSRGEEILAELNT
jgi:hypothetical protein